MSGAEARSDFIHFRAADLKGRILEVVAEVNEEIDQIEMNLGYVPGSQETDHGRHLRRKATLSSISRMLLHKSLGDDVALSEVKESTIIIYMAVQKAMARLTKDVAVLLPGYLNEAFEEISNGSRDARNGAGRSAT